jgi:two-component system sensor histidine kinase PilS (NtrC family)
VDLRSRLFTLIAVRVVVSTLLLGSAILLQFARPDAFPVEALFSIIGATYALSVIYAVSLRFVEAHPWIVDAQLGVDAVLVSAFILVTGGITSYFSSLYVLPIMAASTIRFRRGAIQVAVLSVVLYLCLVGTQYLDLWSRLPRAWQAIDALQLPGVRLAEYTVATNVLGFLGVAMLSGSLAEKARATGVRLERASTQIADLRAFNQAVIDGMLSGLVTTDATGVILTFNRAACSITGVESRQAIGRSVMDVLQLPVDFIDKLQQRSVPKSVRVEHLYMTPDQRRLDIGLVATTLALPDGRTGALVTFQDVTEVRRLERGARIQQRLAAVGEMAAGIAHEIRNPLASMSGSIQVLREELALSTEQAQLMDIVVRESERLNDTIRSFLDYARPQRASITRVDVSRVVRETAVLLRNSGEIKPGHRLDVVLPESPIWVEADGHQIRQILWNLATNGLRAMPSAGCLELAAGYADDGTGAFLVVRDEGVGIPADAVDGVFQPFRSTFEKGTGLGLAIVHRIVSDYGGTIQLSSTVGVGTTFRVTLPAEMNGRKTGAGIDVAPIGEEVVA